MRCGNNNGGNDPHDFPFASSHSSFIIPDVLSGSFLHIALRMTTPLPVHPPLHYVCYIACDSCSKRSPILPLYRFSESFLVPLLTTRYKVPSSFRFPSLSIPLYSSFPRTLATLFSFYHLSFQLTLRCHLEPQSTLVSPEFFLSQ